MNGKFEVSLKPVLDYEAGWANNPADRGGETIFGVSRNNHGTWPGWATVDAAKNRPDFPACVNKDRDLQALAIKLYREQYWNEVHGDELPWKMATAVFDMAVNSGPRIAAKEMQVALKVKVDGIIGPKTVKAAWDRGEDAVIEFMTNRIAFYVDIMVKKPDQRIWAKNWVKRLVKLCDFVLEDDGPAPLPS